MKDLLKTFIESKIAGYWHIEMFIAVPWLIWFSFKVQQGIELLKIIANG